MDNGEKGPDTDRGCTKNGCNTIPYQYIGRAAKQASKREKGERKAFPSQDLKVL
jgi:hypothetical protein